MLSSHGQPLSDYLNVCRIIWSKPYSHHTWPHKRDHKASNVILQRCQMTSWKCFISSVWFPHLSTKLSNSRYTKVSQFGSKVHTDVLIGSLPEARATKFSAEWQLPNGISTSHSAVQPQQPGMHYAKCATLFMVILKLPCSSKHLHSYTCTSKRRNLREGMHFVNAGLACDPESFLYQWTVCYS